ncbi:hypothetical protein LINPERHAP2_LOCUS24116 [Linum perenne]
MLRESVVTVKPPVNASTNFIESSFCSSCSAFASWGCPLPTYMIYQVKMGDVEFKEWCIADEQTPDDDCTCGKAGGAECSHKGACLFCVQQLQP